MTLWDSLPVLQIGRTEFVLAVAKVAKTFGFGDAGEPLGEFRYGEFWGSKKA